MKVLGNLKKGLVFVVSAPAGTGKTTLVRMAVERLEGVVESISYTTREPRPNEKEGKDYYFVTAAEFERMVSEGEFLEYASVFGHYYGTSRKKVEEQIKLGRHVVLVIDTQGASQVREKLDVVSIFIQPPDLNELERRLQGRKSDSKEAIATRLSWAQAEIAEACRYDYQIINEDLQVAYDVLRSIIIAESHRIRIHTGSA